jgi:hypothetical protein
MGDVLLGLAAIAVGALFCFRGYLTMRIIIPVWGAFAGFFLGAGLVAGLGGEGFLSSTASWLVGLALAVVFGMLAYLYFEVSVALAMSAIGFVVATSILVALGVTWNWLIVLVGVAMGVLLAFLAIVTDLPMVLLTVLTALAGSSVIVAGVMLVAGTISNAQLGERTTTEVLTDDPWWYLLYLAVAVAGIAVQIRSAERLDVSLRQSWEADGGRQMRRG